MFMVTVAEPSLRLPGRAQLCRDVPSYHLARGRIHIHSAGPQTTAPSACWIFRKRGCLAGCVYHWVEELQEADNNFFSSICAGSDPFI